VASATYETGPWAGTVAQNFQKGYSDLTGNFATEPRKVASYETWDALLTFTGIKAVKLALGVKNVLDRDPPYTNAGGQFAAGYDIAYADVRGRFVYGSVAFKFR
jgi:iron complex outermembrane receptor protein